MSERRAARPVLVWSALFVLFLLIYPGLARGDDHVSGPAGGAVLAMAGMTDEEMADWEARQIPAGRPDNPDYQPVQKAADDSSMALIAAAVFGLPVAGWVVVRAMKKTKKG